MSRWIDADRLLTERMKSMYYHLPNGDTAIPIIDIEHAPNIDICFCRECKYWDEEDRWCNVRDFYGWEYKADDFCSYGCRDSEKPNNSKERSK